MLRILYEWTSNDIIADIYNQDARFQGITRSLLLLNFSTESIYTVLWQRYILKMFNRHVDRVIYVCQEFNYI